jgi:DNA polymerase sigma
MNDEFGGRRIDIGVFQRKCSGRKYVQFINGFLASLPVIRPLFFVLFSVLKKFELHRPTDCGLKTYTIFLMILTSLQAYP